MIKMNLNQCCRVCLSDENLNPIFGEIKLMEQYATVYKLITGEVVELNDKFPKVLCTECVNFINKSLDFRKKCNNSFNLFTDSLARGVTYIGESYNRASNEILINIRNYFNDIKIEIEVAENNDQVMDNDIYNEFDKDTDNDINGELNKIQTIKNKIKQLFLLKAKAKTKEKLKEAMAAKKVKSYPKPPTNPNTIVECPYCKKKLKYKQYKLHKRMHTSSIICEHCAARFSAYSKLLRHCRSKHGYERKDKCTYCDYLGTSPENVRIHERLHTGEKPYCCSECGTSFHRYSTYKQHIPIHLTDKTVKCDICPKMFKSVPHMRIHKDKVHTECRYIYKCNICKNTFARRFNVVKHLIKQHGYDRADVSKGVERTPKRDLNI